MSIEATLALARERRVAIDDLRARSAAQVEALRQSSIAHHKAERRRRIRDARIRRAQVASAFAGVENLCMLGRAPEVQALITAMGPIELWGWHIKQDDWSWSCYIRLEQDRLAICNTQSDQHDVGLQLYYQYAITDPIIVACGKHRLYKIARGYSPFDEEAWAMVDHELARFGFIQESEPVIMQVLVECATDEGLRRWFMHGR